MKNPTKLFIITLKGQPVTRLDAALKLKVIPEGTQRARDTIYGAPNRQTLIETFANDHRIAWPACRAAGFRTKRVKF